MNNWDFLIQREGEKTWSSVTDISRLKTGKYRLMVRTPKLNQAVDISITYYPESNLRLTKRRKYYRQTNDRGFLAILPFTPLGTGAWEISCRPDLMNELCGENWHKKITLEVFSNTAIETQQQIELATEIARFKEKRHSILGQNLAELTINRDNNESLSLELDSLIFEQSKHRMSVQEMIQNIEEKDFELSPEKEIITDELVPINQIEESKQEDLCVDEILVKCEESSLISSQLRLTNYAIELTYLEYDSSIIFDIEVFEPDRQSPKFLDLPDPKKMRKFLSKKYAIKQQILPPKLYPNYTSSRKNKSIQFSKLQPYPLSA
ncbi:MAG: hypothetical protein DCF12_02940 [Snowella sp.]|jgi:hypothetical protein|nr:MAG: hypothetical protein DCF12_02940 [Snowella sp.]